MDGNVVSLNKLVVAKQIYLEAIRYASNTHSIASRLLALIAFDLAVETFLKISVVELGSDKKPDSKITELFDDVNKRLMSCGKDCLRNRDKIDRVRRLRNDAQHEARYPTELEIEESRLYVRNFLNDATPLIWGSPFDSISLVQLIQNETARSLLDQAEKAIAEENGPLAVQKANQGISGIIESLAIDFDWITSSDMPTLQIIYPGSFDLEDIPGLELKELFKNRQLTDNPQKEVLRRLWMFIMNMEIFASAVKSHLTGVQESLLIISLGLNNADWLRFRKLVSHQSREDKDIPEKIKMIARKDAEWVVAYVTNTIIEIENRVGDIEKPNFA